VCTDTQETSDEYTIITHETAPQTEGVVAVLTEFLIGWGYQALALIGRGYQALALIG